MHPKHQIAKFCDRIIDLRVQQKKKKKKKLVYPWYNTPYMMAENNSPYLQINFKVKVEHEHIV